LVEHLAGGFTNIDIRAYAFYQPRLPPFVNLIPLVLILILIWRRQVFDRHGNNWGWWARLWGQKITFVASILAGILAAYIALMILLAEPVEGEDPISPIITLGILIMGFFTAHLLNRLSKMLDIEGAETPPQKGRTIL